MIQLKKVVFQGLLGISFLLLAGLDQDVAAQVRTLYSRQSGYWNDNAGGGRAWSQTGHNGGNCNCLPDNDDIVLIGDDHTVIIPPGYNAQAGSLTIDDDGNDGELVIGENSNTSASLTVAGDILINSGGIIRVGGDGDATHSLTVGGNLVNNNIFDLINEVFGTDDFLNVTFNGSATRSLSGPGDFTFNNLTLNTGGNNLTIESNIRIQGVLTFSANGLLVVDGNSNITLDEGASISGANANRYIQLDGTTATNSQLIRENGADDNDWEFLFPIGTATGGYTPLDMTGATVVTTNPDNNSTLAVKAIYSASAIGKMRRTFRLVVAGNNNGTTITDADFSYNSATDVSSGDVIGNYATIWHFSETTGWSTVGGTAPGSGYFTAPSTGQSLNDGTYFYTIGTSSAYPSVWYSYQNGVWNNSDVWTLDPSGTTLVNPLLQYPSFGDEVVILNGFTVTSNVNNSMLAKTTIQGGAILDMAATTGNNLGIIAGSGLLRVNGVNLPVGQYDEFISTLGGTIEYYNAGGTINPPQDNSNNNRYNNVLFSNSTGAAVTFTSDEDVVINGNLNITQTGGGGTVTWEINDGNELAITINGDLIVSAGGRIRAGGNENNDPHELTLLGNLNNSGSIKFFDENDNELDEDAYDDGDVYLNELQGNAVNVIFSGGSNRTVTCNGQTDFYRFIVDKGTGRQAILTVYSSDAANFRLFGPTDLSSDGPVANEISNNALSLINGTLELTGIMNIPNLCSNETQFGSTIGAGQDYLSIPQNAGLWINSADVTINIANNLTSNDDQRILIDGMLRISSGTLNGGHSRGIGAGNSGGIFLMEGGTVNVWQFRPLFGGNNIFSYIQTGGVVNIGTTGYSPTPDLVTPALSGVTDGISNGYARFSLPESTCSFEMSGGTMNIGTPTTLAGAGGWDVQSSAANYNVSGGTINVFITTGGNTFGINSTTPLYNLNVYKTGGGALTATLNQALTVLNDLVIVNGNTPTLNCNGNNLTIGRNLTIDSNTTLAPGANTITFNGTGAQIWTHNGTITGTLTNVVVNKSTGTLTLDGSQTFPDITGTTTGLTLTSGTLNDGGKTLTVTGALSNSAVHTGTGAIVYSTGTGTGTIARTIGGTNGTFGNLTITTNTTATATFTVSTSGRQTVTGNLQLNRATTSGTSTVILNIGSNELTVLGNITSSVALGANYRIQTSGFRNDGGLTRQAVSGTDLLFPVGSPSVVYTPITINVSASTAGLVTVRPVASEHPNVTQVNQSVQYYWRVVSSGFSGITAVNHKTYTYSSATRNAAGTTYKAARYDPVNFQWSYSDATYNSSTGNGTAIIALGASPFAFNTSSGWTGVTGTQLDGEYTAGNEAAFGTIIKYYSRVNNGNWNTAATWSNDEARTGTSSTTPCNTCPVIIGNGTTINHTINVNGNNTRCGSLQIASGSVLNCSNYTNLNFGVNTHEVVTGKGTLRISHTAGGTASFPAGDFRDFVGPDGGTVEWYGTNNTAYTIPVTPATYYNVVINPNNALQTITFPATNLTVYNDLAIMGAGTTATNSSVATALTIQGNVNVNAGTFQLSSNTAGTSVSLNVTKNTTINSGASMLVQDANTGNHSMVTSGSIVNNGTMNLRRSAARYLNLQFTGTANASLTTAGVSTFNSIEVNKGNSQTAILNIDGSGTINTQSNNWLTLTNGTVNFNAPLKTFVLTNTGSNSYAIPSNARLRVQSGTVNISDLDNTTGTSNDSDLLLAGTLEVAGGTVNINSYSNRDLNNDIEYAAAGSPEIIVSAGSLYVNGAIRRSTATLSGALVYNQTGGTVTVGGRNCDANDTRGVFEIENNPGSSFTLTGTSSLTIVRSTDGNAFADLYLNPESSNVDSNSTIQIGANNLGAEVLSVNVGPAVGKFTVLGATGNAQTVNMVSSELNTSGTLTINQASTLNTNSLDVNIGGDLSITGTYNGSGNTTTFNGSAAQDATLSATSTFLHMTVDKPSGTVMLSGTSPTITNLNILNGVLDVSTIGLTVTGHVVNNSSQTGTGSITLSGAATAHTITSNGGSFTNLTLGTGSTSKTVSVIGNLTINGILSFAATNRYLSIGGYRLTLGASSTVTGAGNSAFIRTNGVSSDLGVVKNWAAGANTFTYPVGTMTNYTPVQFSLTVTTPGSLTVTPVNSRHPSYGFLSTEQILNYYWIIRRDNSIAYTSTGSHVYNYPAALMGGAGGTSVAGFLNLSNPTGWVTSSHGGSATATDMTFTNVLNANLPPNGITYHYTVGTIFTLPNPIAPVYSRLSNASVSNVSVGGNWSDPASWTFSTDGMGPGITNAPIGSPVVILSGARINVDVNSRTALTTQIDGILSLGTSVGHDFVVITGTGTLRSATNTFPAGDYTAFVAASGGTIEYVAPMTMNNRAEYNNLSIIGTGGVTMTNTDIILNGDLIIGSGTTLNNNANNSDITLAGDWTNNGSFTAGTGTVIMNGTTGQALTGSTTFANLTLTKASGNLTLSGSGTTTVNGTLTLTNGHLVSSSSHRLALGSTSTASGGSASSFIAGPVQKVMGAGGSFTYPVGSIANRYRPITIANTGAADTWTIEYINDNPYDPTSMNTVNIQKVSEFEHWNVTPASGSNAANITLTYNTGSYHGSDVGTVANLRVGHWDGSQWDLPPGGGIHLPSGSAIAGSVTVTNVTDFSPFTLSSLDLPSPLPIQWISFTASRVDHYTVELNWTTAQENNNERFEIERSADGMNFFKIETVAGAGNSSEQLSYQYLDSEASGSQRHYYRIRQIDYDGNFDFSDVLVLMETGEVGKRWMVSPNPVSEGQSLVLSGINPAISGDEEVNVIVVSSNGQVVFQQTGVLADIGSELEQFSSYVRSGVYVMRIISGGHHETFRITKY